MPGRTRGSGPGAARVELDGAAQDDEHVAAGAALHRQQLALIEHAQPRNRQHLRGVRTDLRNCADALQRCLGCVLPAARCPRHAGQDPAC